MFFSLISLKLMLQTEYYTIGFKKLTNFQLRVLQNVFSVCSVLLFCKLAFTEAIRWRSYHEKEQTFLKNADEKSINFFCLIKLSKDLILC